MPARRAGTYASIYIKRELVYVISIHCDQWLSFAQAAFLEKNNDALHDSLGQLMVHSTDPFVKELFPASSAKKETNSKKLALISVGSKFKVSMAM